MIRRVFYTALVAVMLAVTGCRERRVIPDDTLADIFHDAFVLNAYVGEQHINIDSLQIYEPIFAKYGYTSEDVVHTIGSFSRRKSARLGTVVEKAISRLESESKVYSGKVVILDTIKNVAVRKSQRVVYKDSLIKANKRADSTQLRVNIFPVHKGHYSINYKYECEGDLDKYPRQAEFYFEDENGFRRGFTSVSLREIGNVRRTLIARESDVRLVMSLGEFKKAEHRKKHPKGHSIKIEKLTVERKLDAEEAIDSLFRQYVEIRIFADGFPFKKDSLALSPDSTRVSTPSAGDR